MTEATVSAHPNIALVKYWGKNPNDPWLPITPSVSATLDTLTTTTTVREANEDRVTLEGVDVHDAKIANWIAQARTKYGLPSISIATESNFPASSGLASSASGFAALAVAANEAFGLDLDFSALCELARMGSVSAARSMLGGFVKLDPSSHEQMVEQLYSGDHWALRIVVAVIDPTQKRVSSTSGMERSTSTSSYYKSWITDTGNDYRECMAALADRDFPRLSKVAESNCCKMHALMLSSKPPLLYWKPGTMAAIETVGKLQEAGFDVFFTIDAGPQVKAFCVPEVADIVQEKLQDTPGVDHTINCGIGDGPSVH